MGEGCYSVDQGISTIEVINRGMALVCQSKFGIQPDSASDVQEFEKPHAPPEIRHREKEIAL